MTCSGPTLGNLLSSVQTTHTQASTAAARLVCRELGTPVTTNGKLVASSTEDRTSENGKVRNSIYTDPLYSV